MSTSNVSVEVEVGRPINVNVETMPGGGGGPDDRFPDPTAGAPGNALVTDGATAEWRDVPGENVTVDSSAWTFPFDPPVQSAQTVMAVMMEGLQGPVNDALSNLTALTTQVATIEDGLNSKITRVRVPENPHETFIVKPISTPTADEATLVRSQSGGVDVVPVGPNAPYDRMAWTFAGFYDDVEVHVVVDPPAYQSDAAAAIPQMGLILRAQDGPGNSTTAFVVDTNVFGGVYSTLFNALWRWNPVTGSLDIGDSTGLAYLQPEEFAVRRVQRTGGNNIYYLSSVGNLRPGDRVSIADTEDSTFDKSGVTLAGVYSDGVFGLQSAAVTVAVPDTPATVLPTPVAGVLRRSPVPPKTTEPLSIYPAHIRARLVKNVLAVKTWHDSFPEPPWNAAGRVSIVDHTGSAVSGTPIPLPTFGRIGILSNHLSATGRLPYRMIEVARL